MLVALALLAGCASGADTDGDGEPGAPSAQERTGPGAAPEGIGEGPRPTPAPAPSADAPPSTDEPEVDRSDLQSALEPLLAAALAELSDAELGVLVVDPQGQQLLAHQAGRPLLPASTLKLVTAAAVLVTLGPDARLATTVETTAGVDADGVVDGDLQLVGGGDPLLATPEYGRWIYPARPRTPLEAVADEVAAVGVRRIDGDVLGVAPGFTGPREADGWRTSYFNDFDARRITGLTVDAGLRTELSWPDDEGADPDDEGADPDDVAAGPDVAPEPHDEESEPDDVRLTQAEDPVEHAAAELVRLLEERGVAVEGRGRAGEVDAPLLGTLARVESAPMHEVLRFMVQRSDNHIADTLLHVVGRVRTGEGSWERGERALLQVLAHLGVEDAGLRLTDGSGLSRDARLTASSLVELDRVMMDHARHAEVWESLLAVAGEPGTLQRRLRATPAQGRLLAKTGSLRDVMSLSGFVRGEGGERHHFALVANEATGADRAVVRAFADELALVLSSDLLACTTEISEGDDGPLGRPPLTVAC